LGNDENVEKNYQDRKGLMSVAYRENQEKTISSSMKSTKTSSNNDYGRSDRRPQASPLPRQPNHLSNLCHIYVQEKKSMKVTHQFDHRKLQNPDPSNAFVFVIVIAVVAILLPFIPIAVNYFSELIKEDPINNTPSIDYIVQSEQVFSDK
jgi:hypothetical protein